MKFYKLLPVLAIALILTSCGSKKKAFKFSEDIVAMENELKPAIEKTESEVEQAANAGDFAAIVKSASAMESQIDKKIKDIEGRSVEGIKRGEEFKKACLHYFQYMKSIYTTYRKFGESTDQDERMKIAQDLQKVSMDKFSEVANLQKEQKEFADANGFTIKS